MATVGFKGLKLFFTLCVHIDHVHPIARPFSLVLNVSNNFTEKNKEIEIILNHI